MAEGNQAEIQVGDRVMINDQNLSGEVVNVREFNGKKTLVVYTEKGRNIVVGLRQVSKVE